MYTLGDKLWGGLEKDNPYYYLRLGKIIEVINTKSAVANDTQSNKDFGKVKVRWIDWGGESEYINITYPCYSNPIIKSDNADIVNATQVTGAACGIYYMPSIGDLAICAYRKNGVAVVLGYYPHNIYQQTTLNSDDQWGYHRLLESGEFSILSKQQAEMYLDKKGNIKATVKTQPTEPTVLPATDLCSVTIGTAWDDTFTSKLVSAQGKDINVRVAVSNGASVLIDSDGNVEIISPKNISLSSTGGDISLVSSNNVTIDATSIAFNKGTKGVARKDDLTKSTSAEDSAFWSFISTLFSIFNAHTHPVPTLGTSLATLTPLTTQPSELTAKVTVSSNSVKAGD